MYSGTITHWGEQRDGIAGILLAVMTEDELRQLRKKVQFGEASPVVVAEIRRIDIDITEMNGHRGG